MNCNSNSMNSKSIGIICIKLNNSIKKIFNRKINTIKYYDIDNNNIFISNIMKFTKYNNMIKFMLVRRKYSLNYIDFIRGKYKIDYNMLLKMFNYMSIDEIENIKNLSFNELWNGMWNKTSNYKIYKKEMIHSNKKFDELKDSDIYNKLITNSTPYTTSEWEIPKGRKNNNESNLMCAMREFNEETSINMNDYTILKCIDPIHDIFNGTNDKIYEHIFYTALANNIDDSINIINNNNEIEEVKWCTWNESLILLRPYNVNKLKILTNLFMFVVNICEINNPIDLKTTL